MTRFSANLGFLWQDRALPDAIRAAAAAGFDAVECHFPFDESPVPVRRALDETGLEMLSLNTRRGDVGAGDNGLCAIPGREDEARAAIREAIGYASAIGAQAVHVMAGRADGEDAHETFVDNLRFAAGLAGPHRMTILIEPLNSYDAPDYFLTTTGQAVGIIDDVGAGNLRLMFDCYHVQIMEGDLSRRLEQLMPVIGHIQIAAVPGRGEPDDGEVDYRYILRQLARLGYDRPVGAEYRPGSDTETSLAWLSKLR